MTHPRGMCRRVVRRHHTLGQTMCICHHLFRRVMEALHPIMSLSYSHSRPLLYKAFSCRHATPAVQVASGSCGFPTLLFLSPAPRHPTTLLELMSPHAIERCGLSELGDMHLHRYSRNRAVEIGSCGVLLGPS